MQGRNRLQDMINCFLFKSDITHTLEAFKESLVLWGYSLTSISTTLLTY